MEIKRRTRHTGDVVYLTGMFVRLCGRVVEVI